MEQAVEVHIHGVYNPSPASYNKYRNKGNLPALQTALRMEGESVVVGDFNLHYPSWTGPSYPRQHLLADDLLNMIQARGALLALPRGTITRDYQGSQTTIDLLFVTDLLANRIMSCGVDEEIENSSDHLPIKTILNLEIQKEPERPRRRNWKAMDVEKFKNTLLAKVPDLLLNKIVGRQRIEEYTKELFYTMEEAVEESTP